MNAWGNGYQMIDSRLDRPASTQTAIRQKEAERQQILAAVELFKAKGGKVTVIESYISKSDQLGQMRRGEVELISLKDIAKRWQLSPKVMPALLGKWPTLMYIMQGAERVYSLEDIRRIEAQPGYKLHKTNL